MITDAEKNIRECINHLSEGHNLLLEVLPLLVRVGHRDKSIGITHHLRRVQVLINTLNSEMRRKEKVNG